jgi:cell division protein FtsW (lipid II flippase)
MVWLIGQAFVNIAVVLGVIPVLGVPLPLISAGGTAMISSMIAIGIVLSFARQTSRDAQAAQEPAEAGVQR